MDRRSEHLNAPLAIVGIPLLMATWEQMAFTITKIHIHLFHPTHIKEELQAMLSTIISQLLSARKQLAANGYK
jgi:hypothetical protein